MDKIKDNLIYLIDENLLDESSKINVDKYKKLKHRELYKPYEEEETCYYFIKKFSEYEKYKSKYEKLEKYSIIEQSNKLINDEKNGIKKLISDTNPKKIEEFNKIKESEEKKQNPLSKKNYLWRYL